MFLIYLLFILIPPLLLFSPVFIWRDPNNWKKYFLMIVLLMTLLAFSYEPKPDSGDLVRYYSRLDIYAQFSLKEVLNNYYYRETGETILIWLAAKLNLPGIIPAMAGGTVFGVSTYITCDYADRKGRLDLIKWILLIQLLFIPFNSVVNNVFNVSAFALVLLAVYRDLIQKKINVTTVLLYLLPCLIQQAAFILIIVRLLAIPVKKLKILAISIIAFLPGVINIFYSNRSLFRRNNIIYGLIERANYYLNETTNSDYAIRIHTVLWHRVNFVLSMTFAILIIIGIIMIWRSIKNRHVNIDKRENTFLSFIFLVTVLAISCISFSAPHYWRFNLVSQMALGVLLILLDELSIKKALWNYAFWVCGMGNFLIQFYRIIRSSVFLDQWIMNYLLSSPIKPLLIAVKFLLIS